MFNTHTHTNHTGLLLAVLLGLLFFTECRGQQQEKPKSGNQPPTAQPAVPAPTQMETGPGIQLVPVDFNEVFPFYITKNLREDSISLYEDGKLTHIKLQEGEWAAISKNKQYFIIYRNPPLKDRYFGNKNSPVGEAKLNYNNYEVEIRNIKNKVIGKGIIDAVGSYEGPDAIYPFDDGKRICISGGYTDQPWFAIYRMKPSGDGFTEDFRFTGPDDVNRVGGFMVCEAQERVVTTYQDYQGDTLLIRCYNLKGNLLWKKIMRDCNADGKMFISGHDGSLALCKRPKKQKISDKVPIHEVIFDPKGKILHEFEVKYKSDSDSDGTYFTLINDQQYFVHSDGGRNIHIYDFEHDSVIIKVYRDGSLGKIYRKRDVTFDGRQLISIDYTVDQNPTDRTLILSDKRIIAEDIETGAIRETPVYVRGSPRLVKRGNKLYVINSTEQGEIPRNESCFKIKIKQ
jgi:hypothetical protein